MELEFPELELHDKFEFQKSGKFIIILQTVVDRQIFSPNMVFDHFGLKNL